MLFPSRIAQFVNSSASYAANLILPPLCVSCGSLIDRHNRLCPACWRDVHFISPPVCERLGIPLPGSAGPGPFYSADAMVRPPAYKRARAAVHYTGVARKLIVKFKLRTGMKMFLFSLAFSSKQDGSFCQRLIC